MPWNAGGAGGAGLACGLVALGLLTWALPVGTAQEESPAGGNRSLEQRLAALEHKLRHLTSATDEDGRIEVVITGANLRLVNGLGRTDCGPEDEPIPDCPNGLGNLIVEYNEPRPEGFVNFRTGSHNVVVGQQHNFSGFGGLVVGFFNEISGDFASVSGGRENATNGVFASVSAGAFNRADGERSSVSGGFVNTASGAFSSVSGGNNRTAAGQFDWVAGPLFADE